MVDWYAGHVVVAEYVRLQTGPDWLPRMARAVGEALNLPPENVHIRQRRTKTGDEPRYARVKTAGPATRIPVRERDLRFWINLDDFLDTGLYSDHRETRVLVRQLAADQDFLNLFAYTGAFTCAAAAGGARSTVTVDRSETNLKWAEDNLALNDLAGPQHHFVRADAFAYLTRAAREGRRFTLAVVDPPSFFQARKDARSFDINQDHPALLRDVLRLMAPGGTLFFSTNHQRFEPQLDDLSVRFIKEMTPATIPEDYRNRQVHRCWRMTAA